MSVPEADADLVDGVRKDIASYVATMSRLGTPTMFADALRSHRKMCQQNLHDEGEYGSSNWGARIAAIDTLAWQEGINL